MTRGADATLVPGGEVGNNLESGLAVVLTPLLDATSMSGTPDVSARSHGGGL